MAIPVGPSYASSNPRTAVLGGYITTANARLYQTVHRTLERTMSSLEIAELTGKQHGHVMRDIKRMLEDLELGVPNFGDTHRNSQNGQEYPVFNLPKDLTLTLCAGYSTVLRKRIIDRWLELEEEATCL